MNFAEHLIALTRGMDSKTNRRSYCRRSVSIDSTSSFSEEDDDDSVFNDKKRPSADSNNSSISNRFNDDFLKIFAANRILDAADGANKKNVYAQRVKHHSGGSKNSTQKVASAWKKITEKFGKPQQKSEKTRDLLDPWRRFSLDTQGHSPKAKTPVRQSNLTRMLSVEQDGDTRRRRFRPRSSSEVPRFKIVSKHAETAEFTVTEPSKLADVIALCKEYFSRLTCYDAVPHFTRVIAVDKRMPVSAVFNAFRENSATAVMLWDSKLCCATGTCHVDDLVCQMWTNARRTGVDRLFDTEDDFSKEIGRVVTDSFVLSMPANTSLMDASKTICSMDKDGRGRCAKRIALINESTNDIVHLLSAWDILRFFSLQISKYHVTHTAFDITLDSILHEQSTNCTVDVFPATKPLKEAIGFLAAKGGGMLVSTGINFGFATLSFVDILRYVVEAHGSWIEADATNKTVEDILRYHTKTGCLIFDANTPLFAVLREWTPSMSADTAVVVVDPFSQDILGILEPENLLQALLLHDGSYDRSPGVEERDRSPIATRL